MIRKIDGTQEFGIEGSREEFLAYISGFDNKQAKGEMLGLGILACCNKLKKLCYSHGN